MVISNTLLRSVVAIAAGEQFNLALKAGGTVAAWGNNLFGQTNVPQNLSNVVAIACGDYHSLALRADGTVASWGASAPTNYYPPVNYGQTNVPAGLTNVVAICAGDTFSTGLKADGTVVSWGRTNTGQTTPPPGLSNLWAVANQNNYSIGLVSFRPITIARQPANVVIGKGERALLSVGVVSTAPVSYRWQRGGQDMPSETNAVLVIPAATSDDQGTYHVVVSNQFASAVSRDVTVNVASIPTILLPPANQVVLRPGPATFSVTATSVFPMFYQWRHLSNIPGATGTSLTLTNVDRFYSGYYSVTVSNFIGSTNVEARLRVISPTALSSATVTNGSLTFTAKDSQGINLTAADVPFFTVWASTNLVDWQPVPNVITVNNNGTLTIMDPEAGNYPHRYYRLGEALTTRIPTAQRLSGPYGQSDGSVVLFSADSASVRLNAGDLPAIKFQASSNLADWFVLTNSIVVSNGVLILRDPTAKDNPQRFYRVEEQR